MPDSLATRCGSMSSSQQAWMIAAEIESCPQPAHSVAPRVADLVGLQRRVVQARLGYESHAYSLCQTMFLRIAPAMKRAVIGVPS